MQKPALPSRQEQAASMADWAMLVTLALVWGSSFILIKRGLDVFSPAEVGAIRVASAWVFLLPLAVTQVRKFPANKLKYLVIMGMLGNFLPAFLFAKAQTQLASSVTGVLNSLTPLFTLLVGVLLFKNTLNRQQSLGLVVAFAGSAILSLISGGGNGSINFYVFFVVMATLCYAISANVIKVHLSHLRSVTISSLAIFTVGPLAVVYLLADADFLLKMQQAENAWRSLGYLCLLGCVGTGMALMVFNKIVQNTSAVFATSVTYIIPLVAIFWGVIDGETLTVLHYLGMATIVAGVYLANRKKKKPGKKLAASARAGKA